MLRSRIIPCLLIHKGGLVKTQRFQDPKYVGDPINAVRIFNEKQADELVVLDIDASTKGIGPNFDLIAKLSSECRMPLCYGGGVSTVDQAVRLVDMGVEKVAISSAAIARPSLVSELASAVGSQSVVVVLDVAKKSGIFANGYEIRMSNNKKVHKEDPFSLAREMEKQGAGEILINSIDNDGMMNGYDIALSKIFHGNSTIPLTILGGAGSLKDMQALISNLGVIGAAAGSLFVFKGKYRAVLISYPSHKNKIEICFNEI
ncbi:AglZ/HisF2 family acetamidino modification protein [Amylibacter sp.]|jgi:imidazole glycerol-phosphate synthase subunit HisF|nr:AglZ/HisF2 family acetamidino modification protein [Amylibacter sp.]